MQLEKERHSQGLEEPRQPLLSYPGQKDIPLDFPDNRIIFYSSSTASFLQNLRLSLGNRADIPAHGGEVGADDL